MKSILVAPYWHGELQNRLFQQKRSAWYLLKKSLYCHGYEINTMDCGSMEKADCILFHDNLAQGSLNYEYLQQCIIMGKKLHFLLLECPVVEPHLWDAQLHQHFSRVITWNDDLVDQQKYFKIFYPDSGSVAPETMISFAQRKLVTMVVGNKVSSHPFELYSERITAIRAFERLCPTQFDLWGRGWNEREYPSYGGTIENKLGVLGQYRFCICYENMGATPGYGGYITEKIMDCFLASCVPIYLGAANIGDYIPTSIFIDPRNFSSYEELYTFLNSMEEKEYMGYMERIHEFITSEFYNTHFSQQAFASTLLRNLMA